MASVPSLLAAEAAVERHLELAEKAMQAGRVEKAQAYAAIAAVYQRRAEELARRLNDRYGRGTWQE